MNTSIKIVSIIIILVVFGFTFKFINDVEVTKQNKIEDENASLQKILTNKVWVWDKTYEGIELGMDLNKKVLPNNPNAFTITFNESDTFSGTTDCNNFTGNYYLDGINITFANIATTKKYCNNSQETEFMKMINNGYVSIVHNVLYLENTSNEPEFTVIFNSVDENIPEEKPPVKNNGLNIGETYDYGTVYIKPLSIEEDSRCPIDVTCIQAGTVRLKIEVTSKVGNSNNNIHVVTLGTAKEIHGVDVVLSYVNPAANSKINLLPSDYGFTFDVTKKADPVNPPEPVAKCYVGGCSSEVCSDRDDVVTNCMYREEFACYQTAKCERQSTGKCGWTETNELNVCLQNAM